MAMFWLWWISHTYDIRTQAAQAVAYYLEQINVPKNVGYVWQLSGSAGKPDSDPFLLKAHVWLFLDEARTSKTYWTITLRTQTR